jgi:hypothetical protein
MRQHFTPQKQASTACLAKLESERRDLTCVFSDLCGARWCTVKMDSPHTLREDLAVVWEHQSIVA